jgi:hypothetical protein
LIDETNLTNYNRSTAELEEFLVFCIICGAEPDAGRAALLTANLMSSGTGGEHAPFAHLRQIINVDSLLKRVEQAKVPKARAKAVTASLQEAVAREIDLRSVSLPALLTIPGVTPPVARSFLIHTRNGVRHVVLNHEMLTYMRSSGVVNDVPKELPTAEREYARLEWDFLTLFDRSNRVRGVGGKLPRTLVEFCRTLQKRTATGPIPKEVRRGKAKARAPK